MEVGKDEGRVFAIPGSPRQVGCRYFNRLGAVMSRPPGLTTVGGLEAGGGFFPHAAEAVAAIHRSVAPGTERHHGVVAALGTDDGVHLTRPILVHSTAAAAAAATSLLSAANSPATAAALGFVSKSASLEKFLFPYGEDEFASTLHANHCFVRQCHWETSSALSGTGPVNSVPQQIDRRLSEWMTRLVNVGKPAPSNLVCTYNSIIAIKGEYATKTGIVESF